MIVRDPSSQKGMAVDDKGRGRVLSIGRSENEQATIENKAYNASSGVLTLSTANESGVFYLSNGQDEDIIIDDIIVNFGPSTSGAATDTCTIRIYKNVTAGTLVSGANAMPINSNRNFSSGTTLTASTFYAGDGTALTVTDGALHDESLLQQDKNIEYRVNEILAKGNSIAVTIEAPTSNTSMKCAVSVLFHLQIASGE